MLASTGHKCQCVQQVGISVHFQSLQSRYLCLQSHATTIETCAIMCHLRPFATTQMLRKVLNDWHVVNALGSRRPLEEKVDWVHFQEAGQRLVGQCAKYFSSEKLIFLMISFVWSDFAWHFCEARFRCGTKIGLQWLHNRWLLLAIGCELCGSEWVSLAHPCTPVKFTECSCSFWRCRVEVFKKMLNFHFLRWYPATPCETGETCSLESRSWSSHCCHAQGTEWKSWS